jgi:hypothetical protein
MDFHQVDFGLWPGKKLIFQQIENLWKPKTAFRASNSALSLLGQLDGHQEKWPAKH